MSKKVKVLKKRRKSRKVKVGNIAIGGENPIRVQTMLNTDTLDAEASAKQAFECCQLGAELIRITTPTTKHVKVLDEIRKILQNKYKINPPLIADIHFSLPAALEAVDYADKIRINPGNLIDKKNSKKEWTNENYEQELEELEKKLIPLIDKLKNTNKPIRIGSNHGSLSDRVLQKFGDTPEGMVESAMEYLRIFQKSNFNQIVVAMKAADPIIMIEANKLLVQKMDEEKMDYPIHLGVTEAGSGFDGRAKSVLGIGSLLLEGIGDTLRVSLTEDPQKEIPVCYSILQASKRRITKTEFVSCPSCGRTQFNIQKITEEIKQKLGNLKGVKIAIMGCIVNGLGEMGDADFGYVGGKPGKINLYYQKELHEADIPENIAVDKLIKLVENKLGTNP